VMRLRGLEMLRALRKSLAAVTRETG
jgi:hypothetical protein